MNIEGRKELAIKAAKNVGKILLNRFGKTLKIKSKGDRDLVTDIDKKAEDLIIKSIKRSFPEDDILSEESHYYSPSALGVTQSLHAEDKFKWIVDPIDGTHNFIHNIEVFGTTLALEYKGEVVVGVIYMPYNDELYSAQKGKGAYCNGKKIAVSKRNLQEATLIFDSSIRYNKTQMLKCLGKLVDKVFNVRMFGSTVRSLTYLAEGKAEIEVEFNDKVWDFAAGLLLVEEAGGQATDFQGRKWNTSSQGYIASNGIVHKDILKMLKTSSQK
jgi:myo-inositol-1(or 4)-monophosphatase